MDIIGRFMFFQLFLRLNLNYDFEWASQVALVAKNLLANAGDIRDAGSIPGRSPGGGHINPLQYPCQDNSIDRGAWLATIYKVAKSWTGLK